MKPQKGENSKNFAHFVLSSFCRFLKFLTRFIGYFCSSQTLDFQNLRLSGELNLTFGWPNELKYLYLQQNDLSGILGTI